MTRFLIKQAYRTFIVQTKNYFGIVIAIVAAAVLACYTLIPQIYSSSFSPQEWIFEFALGCSALCLIILLFKKRPAFVIHPATVCFFSSISAFGRIKALVLTKKIIGLLCGTGFIGIIICNFKFTGFFAGLVLCFTSYFLALNLIRWFRYNSVKAIAWISEYIICTACFLLNAFHFNLYLTALQVLIAILLVFLFFGINIDMSRYYEDSLYIERIKDASRHKRMAVMQQITADHIANKRHNFMLSNLPVNKNNILFCKVVIETLRMSKQVMVLLLSLLVFAIIINCTSLFSSIPFIGAPGFSQVIGMFALTAFLVNLKEMYLKRFLSIVAKHQKGLFLPYSNVRIMLNYSLICNILAVFAVVAVGIALQTTLLCISISVAISFIGVSLSFWRIKPRFIAVISNIIIFIAAYFLF